MQGSEFWEEEAYAGALVSHDQLCDRVDVLYWHSVDSAERERKREGGRE